LIIPEAVDKFPDCGDPAHGFARIRCDTCVCEYLLAFSCRGRWLEIVTKLPQTNYHKLIYKYNTLARKDVSRLYVA
jgi:hypothetical protein